MSFVLAPIRGFGSRQGIGGYGDSKVGCGCDPKNILGVAQERKQKESKDERLERWLSCARINVGFCLSKNIDRGCTSRLVFCVCWRGSVDMCVSPFILVSRGRKETKQYSSLSAPGYTPRDYGGRARFPSFEVFIYCDVHLSMMCGVVWR